MKLLAVVAAFGALAAPADARSLEIHGVTGFLSEYELSASVAGDASSGIQELSGPLNIKHVGLCTHSGPNEMVGFLKLQFVSTSTPIIATLNFDGRECSYRGPLSESSIGVLTCSGGLRLPLRLWTKAASPLPSQ